MNCDDIQQQIVEQEPPFAAFVTDHLAHCGRCRVFAEHDLRVRAWLRLKSRETAGPTAAERVALKIRLAIADARPVPVWRLWLEETALPAAARAAAALALVAGIAVLWRALAHAPSPSGRLSRDALSQPYSLTPTDEFLPDHRLALQPELPTNPPHSVIRLAPATGIQYGAPGSRLVNWEQ
ncbi:MAG: hypothetical protein N2652_08465 [Kiritimatiellae bacterium]|nr:hypothetical protein [Kiritimatiellia bacterium]